MRAGGCPLCWQRAWYKAVAASTVTQLRAAPCRLQASQSSSIASGSCLPQPSHAGAAPGGEGVERCSAAGAASAGDGGDAWAADHGASYIVRFTDYRMADEHRSRLEAALAGQGLGWRWRRRTNPAARFPTDFGLVQLAQPAAAAKVRRGLVALLWLGGAAL